MRVQIPPPALFVSTGGHLNKEILGKLLEIGYAPEKASLLKTFKKISLVLSEFYEIHIAYLLFFDKEEKRIIPYIQFRNGKVKRLEQTPVVFTKKIIQNILQNKKTLILGSGDFTCEDKRVRSLAGIPILSGKEIIGICSFLLCNNLKKTPSNIRRWNNCGKLISLLLIPPILVKEEEYREILSKLTEEISRLSIEGKEIEEILYEIANEIKTVLKLDSTTIFLREGNKLLIKAKVGLLKELNNNLTLNDKGITVHAFKTGKEYYAPDVLSDPYYLYSGPEIRSEISIPIKTGNRIIGVLDIKSKSINGIDWHKRKTLKILAPLIGYSVINAKIHKETKKIALHDPLTGIYNRRGLALLFDREAKRAKRYREKLAVMFIDLDRFKEINDRFGHLAGDKILKKIAQILHSNIRGIDIIARIGGDEFLAVLVNADHHIARFVAKRLNSKIKGGGIPVTLSIGVSIFPDDGENLETLIGKADRACYFAKRDGGNKIVTVS